MQVLNYFWWKCNDMVHYAITTLYRWNKTWEDTNIRPVQLDDKSVNPQSTESKDPNTASPWLWKAMACSTDLFWHIGYIALLLTTSDSAKCLGTNNKYCSVVKKKLWLGGLRITTVIKSNNNSNKHFMSIHFHDMPHVMMWYTLINVTVCAMTLDSIILQKKEVISILHQVNPHKAPGLGRLKGKVLKDCAKPRLDNYIHHPSATLKQIT